MANCNQCLTMSDGTIKLCYECLEKRIKELEGYKEGAKEGARDCLRSAGKRIKELEGVMVIIQTEASEGLATMKNVERLDIQRLLRRISSLVAGCQIVSKP